MTPTPLRLVFDQGDRFVSPAIDVPRSTTDLHIHLHLGAEAPHQAPLVVADQQQSRGKGRSGIRLAGSVLLGVAGVGIVVGAYDFGARTADRRQRALTASQIEGASPSGLAPGVTQQHAALPSPSELPPGIRQQLALPPTVTAPPGTVHAPGTPDPFGLQR
jgi:hypothetical protein